MSGLQLGDYVHQRAQAKWVLHCIKNTDDFDHLSGDVRDAMTSMARTIIDLTAEHAARESLWEVTECDPEALQSRLDEGWEPYAVLWVRKDKFTDKLRHFLKRRATHSVSDGEVPS